MRSVPREISYATVGSTARQLREGGIDPENEYLRFLVEARFESDNYEQRNRILGGSLAQHFSDIWMFNQYGARVQLNRPGGGWMSIPGFYEWDDLPRWGTAEATYARPRICPPLAPAKRAEPAESSRDDDWLGPNRSASAQPAPVASMKFFDPGARRWIGKAPAPIPFVVDRLIPRDAVTTLGSAGGRGKSTLLQQLMTCVAAGVPFLGFGVQEAGTAVGIFCEDSDEVLHNRQAAIYRGLGLDEASIAPLIDPQAYINEPPVLWSKNAATAHFNALDVALGAAKGKVKLVVLDGAAILYDGNEIDRGEVTRFMAALTKLAAKHRLAIVLVMHESKTSADNDTHAFSGSTAWLNRSRSALKMIKRDPDSDDVQLIHIKVNGAKKLNAPIHCTDTGMFFSVNTARSFLCRERAAVILAAAIVAGETLSRKLTARNNAAKHCEAHQGSGSNFDKLEFTAAIDELIRLGNFAEEEYKTKNGTLRRLCRPPAPFGTQQLAAGTPHLSEAEECVEDQ